MSPAPTARSFGSEACAPRRRLSPPRSTRQRALRQALHDTFGLARLRPGQQEVIDAVLAGRHVFAVMPTGAGKSLCYQLPALLGEGLTLVVSPLIALMKDQCDKLHGLGIEAVALNSGIAAAEEHESQEALQAGRARLLFTTPERLATDAALRALLGRQRVALFVIDEAHCIPQWGHDFRPAFLELGGVQRALGAPPVLALTATASADVIDDVAGQLGLDDFVLVNTGVYRENLHYRAEAFERESDRLERIGTLVRQSKGPGIVYATTVRMAQQVHAAFSASGESVALYHARLAAAKRREAQDRFMAGEVRIMVATNAFGLGIDKADLRFVLHCQMPASLDAYYQESGRAGRDGEPAICSLLYQAKDRAVQQFFMAGRYPGLAELQAVCAALQRAPRQGDRWRLAELQEALDLPAAKLQVAVALLRSHGVVAADRRLNLRLRGEAPGREKLEALLTVYVDKAQRDREALERMVFYARSGLCRWAVLLEHFDEELPGGRCGHCDNCQRMQALEAARAAGGEEAPSDATGVSPRAAFSTGQAVCVPRFGEGVVAAADAHTVTVEFPDARRRSFMAAYVEAC